MEPTTETAEADLVGSTNCSLSKGRLSIIFLTDSSSIPTTTVFSMKS